MPSLETAAPFHEVRIHPRTGAIVPLNYGWLSPLLSTDDDWYDPEELTVSAHANFDGRYGVRLSAVPRNGSVVVLDMSNPSSATQLTQTNSTPGIGEFWVAEQGAQADYGQVNLGFGFVEVHSSMSGVLLEVHYQSVGSVLSNDVINNKITDEVTSQVVSSTPYPPGHIYGLTLSNSSGDPTNDLDIAAGSARDSTNAANLILAATLTKRLDAAWAVGTNQGGLDTGSIANTTYHVWLIKRSDTGVVDALFSTSATAPTMPANYDYKQRIGAIIRSAGAILAFVHDGYDTFRYVTRIADIAAADPGTSAVTRTLTVPVGVVVYAIVIHSLDSGSGTTTQGIITALDETDTAPAAGFNDTGALSGNAGYGNVSGTERRIKTNTSSQIRSRVSGSSASVVDHIATIGWIDRRVI